MIAVGETMETQDEEPPLPSDPKSPTPATSSLKLLKSENSQMLRSSDTKSSASQISQDLKFETASTETVTEKGQKWNSLQSYIWHDENRTQETADVPTRKFSSVQISWSKKVDHLMAHVGFSVGLSNIWHFPHLCLHNGGGSFLLIYILLMFFVGFPLLFLEMGVGQRMGLGSIGAWKNISPWIGGLGYSNFMVCCIVGAYYSVLIAWCFYYLLQSFHFPLPWTLCPILKNSSDPDPECTRTPSTMFFWYRHVLKASDQIKLSGLPDDHLTLCLFVTWFITGLSLMNRLKSTSKMVYVLVLLPFIFLFGFLVRTAPLEGASFGIMSLLDAKIPCLFSLKVWHQTTKQMLFSLSPGFGSYMAISSYAHRSNNCITDAFVVVILNLFFSIVATVVMFAFLGHLATENSKKCYEKNIDIVMNLVHNGVLPAETGLPDSVQSNFSATYLVWLDGLSDQVRSLVGPHVTECDLYKQLEEMVESSEAFLVTVTNIIGGFPKSSTFAIIIFFLLLNLGLSSLIGIVKGIAIPIQDALPSPWKQTKWLTVCICVFMFLSSLTFVTPSGSYLINLMNEHWLSLPLFGIATLESIAIAWLYGARRFLSDMIIILNRPIWPIYRWLWKYVIPLLLLIMVLKTLSQLHGSNITYIAWNSSTSKEVSREYPFWAQQLCISMIIFIFLPVPAYFLYHSFQVVCYNRKATMTTTVGRRSWRNSIVGRTFGFHISDGNSTPVICVSSISTRSDFSVQSQE